MKLTKLFFFAIILAFIFISMSCHSTIRKMPLKKTPSNIVNLKSITIHSKILRKPMKVNIYFPPNYSKTTKYPVLYILPGSSGEQNFCMPELKIQNFANNLINKGKIKPLIIVSTEMDNSFGLNSSTTHTQISLKGKMIQLGRYEDYLDSELVKYIDSHYSTINNRDSRYIGGISDGGYIAVRTAILHPYEYSKVGGHSPNLDHENPNPKAEALYFPEKQKTNNKDIYYLAKTHDLSKLSFYLDCGNKDTHKFYISCDKLNKILISKKAKVQYHLNPGTHGKDYWEGQIPSYLMFYAGK